MQCTNYLEAILFFAKERQRKHSSDPLIQTNIVIENIFSWILSSLPLFQRMNCPCIRGKFHFSPKGHATSGSGKEWEVKISSHRVNGEIWSVRVIQWMRKDSCPLLPCPFYLNIRSLQPSITFCHLFQHPGPWRWEYHLFSLKPQYIRRSLLVQFTWTLNYCDNTCCLESSFIFKTLHKHQLTQIYIN